MTRPGFSSKGALCHTVCSVTLLEFAYLLQFIKFFLQHSSWILKRLHLTNTRVWLLCYRGVMKIAEVESRCGNVKDFEKQLGKYGFHCTGRDTSYQYFFLLEFKKKHNVKKKAALPDLHLKPCIYKKR